MRHMGHAIIACDAAHQLDDEIEDYQEGRRHRYYSKHIDDSPRIERREEDQECVDRTRGSKQDDVRVGDVVDDVACHAAQCTCEEVVEEELLASHSVLDCPSEDVEGEHVEEDVAVAGVDEHVGHELPPAVAVVDAAWHEGQGVGQSGEEEFGQAEDCDVDCDEDACRVEVHVAEASVDDCRSHFLSKVMMLRLLVKHQFLHSVQFLHITFLPTLMRIGHFSGVSTLGTVLAYRFSDRATVFFNLLLV